MDREECEPVRRGRKLRMAVAGWRSRRSRPSVTPDPSRSARVRPASIGQGTPIMARSLSAIPDGDRGDGTARSRWLPSARPAVSVDPSPTPHPRHLTGKRADRHRSHGGSCIGRACSDMRAARVSGRLTGGRSRGRDGNASRRTGLWLAIISQPDPQSRRGSFRARRRLRPPDQKGATSAVRRRCTVPLDALGEMCFGLFVGSVGAGIFQSRLHLRPEPAVMAGRVRVRCRCLSV